MPALGVDPGFWRRRPVFVTGHTGFMGGWLSLWLAELGARIHGYALPPPTEPNLFEAIGLANDFASTIADVRDRDRLQAALADAKPEVVFHLAAQPLVGAAYREPAPTYATNVMGTVNLLDAVRGVKSVRSVVVVTTDKVYENLEWEWGYRETDVLGGREPYGSSKACAELAVTAFRESYFRANDGKAGVATVRAGNVIGGGDWAGDRLVPDAMRAFAKGETVPIRHPGAVRPWQHVLEPVRGLLMLAQRLAAEPVAFGRAWNLGPAQDDARSVEWVIARLAGHWGPAARWRAAQAPAGHYEANLLVLDSSRAARDLGWRTRWTLDDALGKTAEWYRSYYSGADVRALSFRQLKDYAAGMSGAAGPVTSPTMAAQV